MKVRATYRLQFNRDFGFDDARRILPYLDRLGISHVYASPITTAQPGSTHGYDVIDPTRINPELGGEDAFRALAADLRARGMGIIIDIVPNHMSVTGGANPWWNDVLARGRGSEFAGFFDLDWDGKILLPFLGEPLAQAIEAGHLKIERRDGKAWIRAYGSDLYPLRDDAKGEDLADLLEVQHYRLAWWRHANDLLNWRRFFTITGLAGLRQEEEAVFEATHALYFRLRAEGLIDGVRVDHVDGLADPPSYCRRLRRRLDEAGGGRSWIIVEKILAAGEDLPLDWGVDGTSGYDFMEESAALFHAADGQAPLARHWAALSGRSADFSSEERQARREILHWEFGAQLDACVAAFAALARSDPVTADLLPAMIKRGLEALLGAFPAYRTYGGPGDAPLLDRARPEALALAPAGERKIVEQLLAWLSGEGRGDERLREEALRRLRQLSAPIAAKAVEDTAFYRYGVLLSRNDVGLDPRHFSRGAADFHQAMRKRAADWPQAMLATATHDHKKGEDVTARLAVLSEVPDRWIDATKGWRGLNEAASQGIHAADEYLLYQMLYGAWPLALDPRDPPGCAAFAERLNLWFEKALREAKLRSSWTEPDSHYESLCRAFVTRLLDPDRSSEFLCDLVAFVRWTAPAGQAASLARTFLRCTAPGIPDCYQGCEYGDFSLVDPDNRQPVEFGARAETLGAPAQGFDALKQTMIADLLRLRRDDPGLWQEGDWQEVTATGPRAGHILAFRRRAGDQWLLGGIILQAAPVLAEAGAIVPPLHWWGETKVGREAASALFERLPCFLILSSGARLGP